MISAIKEGFGFERRVKDAEDWTLIYSELVNGYHKHLEVRSHLIQEQRRPSNPLKGGRGSKEEEPQPSGTRLRRWRTVVRTQPKQPLSSFAEATEGAVHRAGPTVGA